MVITTTPLRERMRRALRIRNVSPRTEYTYIHMVAGFAAHFRRSPDRLGRPQIEQYLLFICDVKKVSYCWYNQCVCALRFFYLYVVDRPRLVQRIPFGHRECHLPVVLSVDELLASLAAVRSLRDRVILTVLYSAGIRLGEVCRLRVDDIDSSRMLLRIQQGKGHKDRFVPLSPIAFRSASAVVARLSSKGTGARSVVRPLDKTEWNTYAKPPFGGPEQVLAYLANYTHRIAISNRRIRWFDGENARSPGVITLPTTRLVGAHSCAPATLSRLRQPLHPSLTKLRLEFAKIYGRMPSVPELL